MEIQTILFAVSQAYRAFKDAFTGQATTDALLSVFRTTLEETLGSHEILYDYIWGKDSLQIDGISQNHVPQPGDTLIMDVSVGKDGVWCDVCRTFFVGEPTDQQRQMYALVCSSLRAGHHALQAGIPSSDIYHAVDSVYAEKGKNWFIMPATGWEKSL